MTTASPSALPRGLRLKNPGNIRLGDDWQGLAPVQSDPDFCEFTDLEHGIRAMAKILLNYEKTFDQRGKITCVANIISRWAPPQDHNDTLAYCDHVARCLGVSLTTPLDLQNPNTLVALTMAIAAHENGQSIDARVAQKGVEMALGITEKA